MSDEEAAQIVFKPETVLNAVDSAKTQLMKTQGNLNVFKNNIHDTAAAFTTLPGLQDKAGTLKDAMRSLVETQQQMGAFAASLDAVRAQYTPSLNTTNFQALLDQQMQERTASLNPNTDEALEALMEMLGEQVEQQLDDDDEELVMAGGSTINKQCPITMKNIDTIPNPVEDQKGYVYDKEGITQFIRQHRGDVACPVLGTSHRISLASLRPCHRILNKRRAQQRWGTQGAQA